MPPTRVSLQNGANFSRAGGVDPERIATLRGEMVRAGKTIPTLAREIGHPGDVSLIQNILGGKRRCLRGKSHTIAVKLGLKNAEIRDGHLNA